MHDLTRVFYDALVSYAQSNNFVGLPTSSQQVVRTTANLLGLEAKGGVVYHFTENRTLEAVWVEAIKNGPWSLDIGMTAEHWLAGVGRDITPDIDVEVGVGLNKNTKQTGAYIGVSLGF